jgi:hypothetical protein
MAARGKHEHNFKVISYSLEPRLSPNIILGCITRPCIATEVVCVLCREDGNRRRHKTHIKKLATDRTVLNRTILGLTRAAIEYEKLWGKPPTGK